MKAIKAAGWHDGPITLGGNFNDAIREAEARLIVCFLYPHGTENVSDNVTRRQPRFTLSHVPSEVSRHCAKARKLLHLLLICLRAVIERQIRRWLNHELLHVKALPKTEKSHPFMFGLMSLRVNTWHVNYGLHNALRPCSSYIQM